MLSAFIVVWLHGDRYCSRSNFFFERLLFPAIFQQPLCQKSLFVQLQGDSLLVLLQLISLLLQLLGEEKHKVKNIFQTSNRIAYAYCLNCSCNICAARRKFCLPLNYNKSQCSPQSWHWSMFPSGHSGVQPAQCNGTKSATICSRYQLTKMALSCSVTREGRLFLPKTFPIISPHPLHTLPRQRTQCRVRPNILPW